MSRLHRHHPRNCTSPYVRLLQWEVPPSTPERGSFRVERSPGIGETYTVTLVNSRSFYVYNRGKTIRRLNVEWKAWLEGLFEEGFIFRDGNVMIPPPLPERPENFLGGRGEDKKQFDRSMREGRRLAEDGAVRLLVHALFEERFSVRIGHRDVRVTVPLDPEMTVRCRCELHSKRGTLHKACPYILAVLLSTQHKYRILDYVP